MNATAVAPAIGFTFVQPTARIEPEYVYAGPADAQTFYSDISAVVSFSNASDVDAQIAATANSEDLARAVNAYPFYATSLNAEGLATRG